MRTIVLAGAAAVLLWTATAQAQAVNPRSSLRAIIGAFQRCGPPQAYQVLAPYLFSIVAQQTGGAGCYQAIAQAGPVTALEVKQTQQFPIGPIYLVRVTHQSGVEADWFIGFNKFTGKIEYLSFQPASDDEDASIEDGPDEQAEVVGRASDRPEPATKDPCELFPRMCPR